MLEGAIAALSLSTAGAGWAQMPDASATSSTNAMINLVRQLVQQGTISQQNGDALIRQTVLDAARSQNLPGAAPQMSEADAAYAAARGGGYAAPAPQPVQAYAAPAPQARTYAPPAYAAPTYLAQNSVTEAPQVPPAPVVSEPAAPPPPPTMRVSYVPETVRKQIRDELREEVMAQARAEHWAAPDQAPPGWVRNITISGDVRVRSESDLYSSANANDIIDLGRVNATATGYDFFKPAPFINAREDRWNRSRVRGRLDVEAAIGKSVTAAVRVATGDDNSPISTNQNLGGGLAKRNIWLDQAYLKIAPGDWGSAIFGRFPNPFRSTDLMFDTDLNFDGFVGTLNAGRWLPEHASLAVRGGTFPLDFGSGDFPNTSTDKAKYPSKWLLSGQIEGGYDFDNGLQLRAAAAYHYFHNIQGQLSQPCYFNGQSAGNKVDGGDPDECSTDGTRSFFPRKGNTQFLIRDVRAPNGDLPASAKQYAGLTYRYAVLDLNASASLPINESIRATVDGDYIRNLAFRRKDACRYGTGVTPITPNVIETASGGTNVCATTDPAKLASGNQGWLVRGTVGYAKPKRWGEWNISANYRYLQSDATLDSLTDSDFHLGGTNTKGYTVAGSVGLFDGVRLTGRWMSANEITGRPLAIDVLQIDLQAEF